MNQLWLLVLFSLGATAHIGHAAITKAHHSAQRARRRVRTTKKGGSSHVEVDMFFRYDDDAQTPPPLGDANFANLQGLYAPEYREFDKLLCLRVEIDVNRLCEYYHVSHSVAGGRAWKWGMPLGGHAGRGRKIDSLLGDDINYVGVGQALGTGSSLADKWTRATLRRHQTDDVTALDLIDTPRVRRQIRLAGNSPTWFSTNAKCWQPGNPNGALRVIGRTTHNTAGLVPKQVWALARAFIDSLPPIPRDKMPERAEFGCSGNICMPDHGCFPGAATVQTPSGLKTMDDLQVGDCVRSMSSDGLREVECDPVRFFGHADPRARARMVRITLMDGSTLLLTPDHFVPTQQGGVMKRAGAISIGDLLRRSVQSAVQGQAPSELVPVTNISTSVGHGLFNPFTESGNIVVDGVVTSCHSQWVLDGLVPSSHLPSVYQNLFSVLRALTAFTGPAPVEYLGLGGNRETRREGPAREGIADGILREGVGGIFAAGALLLVHFVMASLLLLGFTRGRRRILGFSVKGSLEK